MKAYLRGKTIMEQEILWVNGIIPMEDLWQLMWKSGTTYPYPLWRKMEKYDEFLQSTYILQEHTLFKSGIHEGDGGS